MDSRLYYEIKNELKRPNQNPNQRFRIPLVLKKSEPNQAVEPTSMAVTVRAPSSTNCASHARGSLLTLGRKIKI